MMLAAGLCIHSLEKKADCSIPERNSACSVGQSFSTESKARARNEQTGSLLRGEGMCCQQQAGFFFRTNVMEGRFPKNPEGHFRVNSTEKTLNVAELAGKVGENDHTPK